MTGYSLYYDKCLFSYDFIGIEIAIGIGIEYLLHVKLRVSLNIISSS